MPEATLKVKFEAKPGKYPPHKGGTSWLHEAGGARTVPFGNATTMKVLPRVVLKNGDTITLPYAAAKMLCKRYDCFSIVKPKAPALPKVPVAPKAPAIPKVQAPKADAPTPASKSISVSASVKTEKSSKKPKGGN